MTWLSPAIDPNLPMELLNGSGMVVELCFLICMARYLWVETRKRGFGVREWLTLQLPPSMNFVVAVMVFDSGVWIRSSLIWSWRRFFHGAPFNSVQVIVLGFGAVALIFGSLCKIRSITKPDLGNGPWLISAGLTALFVVVTVVSH